jgi:hypothetical protein
MFLQRKSNVFQFSKTVVKTKRERRKNESSKMFAEKVIVFGFLERRKNW